ncbi:MAG: hypothetical protein JSU63_04490 [Phycisphaerales bacterium]|nr:MAG: hypothetical protein JSU63_04490 [Phycisphaerales bacterium]
MASQTSTTYWGSGRVIGCTFLAVICAATPTVSGQWIPFPDGAILKLTPESQYQEGCFEGCMCPVLVRESVRGTFKFIYQGFDPDTGVHVYAVEDVYWRVPLDDASLEPMTVIGSGVYRIGSPDPITLLQHRMELDLRIGDEPIQHFDSGWVPFSDPTDLHLNITISMNNMYCYDKVFVIDAYPVPEHEIQPYVLVDGSTFQRGCFDPCDCLLGPELPVVGTFKLVFLAEFPLYLTEFAVVDVSWHVLFSSAGECIPITGFGVYQLLGDFIAQERLILELIIGDEERAHLDSGPEMDIMFPRIDAVVSENGIYCYDTVIHVIGDPVNVVPCGGPGTPPCASDEFCKRPVGHCANDVPGVCTPIPQGCPDVWDPVCGCDGVTYGNECEADAAAVSIAHWGECEVVCRPADDGFGCTPIVCSDIPEEQCIATILQMDPVTGAIYTIACECMDFNLCHVEWGDATPFAVGYCPNGGNCELVGIDTNGDGVYDQYTAECVGVDTGACCTDLGGSPLPVPVCTEVTQDECGLGFFEGVGTSCGPVEACCFTPGNYCGDEDPFCCLSFGGIPQGPGSTCSDIVCPQVCGGFTGIVCEDPGTFCKYPEGTCEWVDHIGICTPIPQDCPAVWEPVCGCDGVTYGNECEADAASMSIAHRGECGQICGPDGALCPEGQFCKYPQGVCGHYSLNLHGMCTPIPDGCPDVWDPVCGCNGVTYGNECEADAAGVSLAHYGECAWVCCDPAAAPPCIEGPYCCADGHWACGDGGGSTCDAPGIVCGPVCRLSPDGDVLCYNADSFCKFPEGTCGEGDIFGMCTPFPYNGCPEIYDPVCGCDGVTYMNECEADVWGASIAHRGPCEHPCSETLGLPECLDGMFCLYPEGTCDDGIHFGVCRPIPGPCPEYADPVCGCDGVTYDNECFAHQAGVSIRHHGPCERICYHDPDPTVPSCLPDEFCKFPMGTCGDLSVAGVCTIIPEGCPEYYDPVCGCDGVTYGNECMADAAVMSVDHPGECAGTECAATRFFVNATDAYCPEVPQTIVIELTPPAGTTTLVLEDEPPAGWVVTNISDNGSFDMVNWKVKWGPFFAPSIPPRVSYDIVPLNDAAGLACFDGTVWVDTVVEQVCGDSCIELSCPPFMETDMPQPPCPSCPIGDCTTCPDGSCRDGRITLCEVIGYACAWKVGCNDDLAGMARAAYVWRHGECYCWDDADDNWLPTACPPPASGLCGSDPGDPGVGPGTGTVEHAATATVRMVRPRGRGADKAPQAEVSVRIDAPAGTSTVALEFDIPRSWQVQAASDGGTWDGLHRKVKWGPFFDNLSRTFSVELSQFSAREAAESLRSKEQVRPMEFTGRVSFDGVIQSIDVR